MKYLRRFLFKLLMTHSSHFTIDEYVSNSMLIHSIRMPSDVMQEVHRKLQDRLFDRLLHDGFIELTETNDVDHDARHVHMSIHVFKP